MIFGGTSAPVLYTQSNQVGAVVPYEVQGPNVQVFVQYQGQTSLPLTLAIAAVAPGLITMDSSGAGQALATNQNGVFNGAAQPAAVGSSITVYVTGVGRTSPAGVDGLPSPSPGPIPYAAITVMIGGQQGNVLSARGVPGQLGLTQIGVQIPSGITPGNAVPIVVEMGGVSSPNSVTIAVSTN